MLPKEDLTSETSLVDMVESLTFDEPGNWPTGWFSWENTAAAHRQLMREHIAKLEQPLPANFEPSRGIVMAGGGTKYFPSLWISISWLRKLGCTLPIEVWYLGDAEMDPAMRELLAPFKVKLIDARQVEKTKKCRILNGWELKPYACLNSAFSEVLFIDADCTPVCDPSFLFDTSEYMRTGSVFWPDYAFWALPLPRGKLPTRAWKLFGLKVPEKLAPKRDDDLCFGRAFADDWEPAWESGQYLIDKKRCYRELALALWICEHSDFYFAWFHGDKEAFHFAWRTLGTKEAMPRFWPDWDVHTMTQHDFDGFPLFYHRTQDKWVYGTGNKKSRALPDEQSHFHLLASLRKLWSGKMWDNTNPSAADKQWAWAVVGKNFLYRRLGLGERGLRLAPDGKIAEGGADLEQRWSMFVIMGKPYLCLCSERELTCKLELCEDSVWRGQWVGHEKCAVELVPAS